MESVMLRVCGSVRDTLPSSWNSVDGIGAGVEVWANAPNDVLAPTAVLTINLQRGRIQFSSGPEAVARVSICRFRYVA
jgi:hypothetical protein